MCVWNHSFLKSESESEKENDNGDGIEQMPFDVRHPNLELGEEICRLGDQKRPELFTAK